MTTLAAEALGRTFGTTHALRDLDVVVEKGSVLGLLGPNGAGKTTTINLFLGLLTPSTGRCLVDGIDVAQDPAGARERVGYVPETVALYPELSGLENLRFFAGLTGQSFGSEQLKSALQRAGLQEEAWGRRVSTYSKGMRQKVGIAIAAAKGATALLLDEPASGLDPKASNELSHLVRDLAAEGVAILMATHDLFRARETCDQLVIMRQGSKVAELSAQDLSPGELEVLYLEHMHE
ncbi:MAG: ABC transporter ATP-binding protein [Acidobacteriota bacterium]